MMKTNLNGFVILKSALGFTTTTLKQSATGDLTLRTSLWKMIQSQDYQFTQKVFSGKFHSMKSQFLKLLLKHITAIIMITKSLQMTSKKRQKKNFALCVTVFLSQAFSLSLVPDAAFLLNFRIG